MKSLQPPSTETQARAESRKIHAPHAFVHVRILYGLDHNFPISWHRLKMTEQTSRIRDTMYIESETYSHRMSIESRGRYHGGRLQSSDDSFHSPTVIPPSALDKPGFMKRYYRRQTRSHTSPRRSATMVTLHDTRFVECRWWNDGWTVKTVVT